MFGVRVRVRIWVTVWVTVRACPVGEQAPPQLHLHVALAEGWGELGRPRPSWDTFGARWCFGSNVLVQLGFGLGRVTSRLRLSMTVTVHDCHCS